MISKRSRRAVTPVESLKQFTVTGTEGVNLSKTATSLNAASQLKNFDIDSDGGLILRKPLVIRKTFPTFRGEYPVWVKYLYDKEYKLYVYNAVNPNTNVVETVVSIQNDLGEAFPIIFRWDAWDSGAVVERRGFQECNADGTVADAGSGGYFVCNEFNLSAAQSVNLNTATILTNCTINAKNNPEMFRGTANNASDTNTLVDETLYDGSLLEALPRTLQIAKSSAIQVAFPEFYIRIVTPERTFLDVSSGGGLSLNANLAADSPYALRDSYNAAMPTVKALALYLPTAANSLGKREYYDSSSGASPTPHVASYTFNTATFSPELITRMLDNFKFTFADLRSSAYSAWSFAGDYRYDGGLSLRIYWNTNEVGTDPAERTMYYNAIKDIEMRVQVELSNIPEASAYFSTDCTFQLSKKIKGSDYTNSPSGLYLPNHYKQYSTIDAETQYQQPAVIHTDIAVPMQFSHWDPACDMCKWEVLSGIAQACTYWSANNVNSAKTYMSNYNAKGVYNIFRNVKYTVNPTKITITAILHTIDGQSATYTRTLGAS